MQINLKNLGVITTGNTPSKKDESYWDSADICFVKPDGIADEGITLINNSVEYISENARSKARVVSKGAVFVTCIGCIGKIGIADTGEYAFNQQINVIEPNEKVLPRYLAYNLLFSKPRLVAIANAPVVPIINKTQFGDFIINIEEDKTKQAEIVSVLDKLTDIMEARKKELKSLDDLIKARFVEMFGDPETNCNEYPLKKLDNLVTDIIAGWSANGEARQKKDDEKAVLKVSAVTQGFFKPEEHKALPSDIEIKKYVFPHKGDLLFSRANTRELVGATAIIEHDYPDLLLPDKLWRVLFTNEINVYYAKYVLSTESIRNKFSAQSTGTSGSMFNVSSEKFRDITIPVPSRALQDDFERFVSQVDKSKVTVQKTLDEAKLLFDSLMQKYFG